jgi:hypothetical protein
VRPQELRTGSPPPFPRNVLRINPQAACGLSLGEISMLFAFSEANSRKSDVLSERLTTSEVWTLDLAGPMRALRRAWGYDDRVPLKEFWSGCVGAPNAGGLTSRRGRPGFW